MTTTFERLLTAELTVTQGDTSYTADDNTQVQFRACTLVNKTATARWVSAFITPLGGAVRYVMYRKVIGAGQSVPAAAILAHVLNAGDKIEFNAEVASAIDLALSGSLSA